MARTWREEVDEVLLVLEEEVAAQGPDFPVARLAPVHLVSDRPGSTSCGSYWM